MLAILATHPIQYQAPVWRLLAARGRVPFEVLYLSAHGVEPTLDPGFGEVFRWDLDLLGGYPHRFPDGPAPRVLGGFWASGLPRCFRVRLRSGTYRALLVPGWHVRACWEAVWLADRLGMSVWISGDSNDIKEDASPKRLMKRLLIGGLLRRVDRFLYVGEATRRLFRSYGAAEAALVHAPHAVDNARFAQQAAAERLRRDAIRRIWGIPDDAFCVLFAGKLETKKRPGDVVAALRLLKTIDPGRTYHALFVGAGVQAAALREQCHVVFDAKGMDAIAAKSSGVPMASFTGFLNQSEISRAYAAANVLVLPSESSETWGLVVNEALACGLPCVVSDACGSAEDMVTPMDPRLCYPVGDVEALARAIQHVAEHPPSAQAMSALIAKFDFVANAKAIERLWTEVTSR